MISKVPRRVVVMSIGSRALVLVLQVILNLVIPDHKSLDAFRTPSKEPNSILDHIVLNHLLIGLNHWDGQYYTHIAKNGYDSEDKLVFLPVYPFLLKGVSHIIHRLFLGYFSEDSCIIISAVTINAVCFVISSILLYYLTLNVFSCETETKETNLQVNSFAEDTVSWFCFNPASVFFTANYTESIYCMVTFFGLLVVYTNNKVLGAASFAISSLIRSNGILNAGFLAFQGLRMFYMMSPTSSMFYALLTILCTVPFFYYQQQLIPRYFCPRFEFCSDSRTTSLHFLPYSFLQEKYWNQGFLKYYKVKQIPNFILSAPMFVLVFWSVYKFTHSHIQSRLCDTKRVKKSQETKEMFFSSSLSPFCIHALFLSLYTLFFTHVQVFTRMMASSSPWIYWYVASLPLEDSFSAMSGYRNQRRLVKTFFTLYFFLGIAMFSNALPWT
jgi:phosphatidylinositol glycan class V